MTLRIAALAALLLLATPASATTVLPLSRAELAARSDTIVRARVGRSRAVRSEQSGRILTRTRLTVLETFKGRPGPELELEQMGGRLDGATLVVPGDARLEAGEEVVAFLRCGTAGRCHLFGLALGKFGVRTDAAGRRIAVRDLAGLSSSSGAPLRDAPVPLDELARELRGRR